MKKNIVFVIAIGFIALSLQGCVGYGLQQSRTEDDLGYSQSRGWTIFPSYETAEERAHANRINAEADYTRAMASRLESYDEYSQQTTKNHAMYRFIAENASGKYAEVYHPGFHRYIPLDPKKRTYALIELSYVPDGIIFKGYKGYTKMIKSKKIRGKINDPLCGLVDIVFVLEKQY